MVTRIHEPGGYCGERRDEMIEHVFGEMGPGASEAFVAHLASCDGCRHEVESLQATVGLVREASSGAEMEAGEAIDMEQEWVLLRRRLRFSEELDSAPDVAPPPAWRRAWMPAAAAVAVTAVLSFSAGYVWRTVRSGPVQGGRVAGAEQAPAPTLGDGGAAPPVSGAGNYFDHFQDFTRGTHNFFRRSRMIFMEFTNLGADADPTFFRGAAGRLLNEAEQYRAVASRMENRKLGELLEQVTGILSAISTVDSGNQLQVVQDVKSTLQLTGLVTALELLDAAVERELEGQPNV